MGLKLAVYNRPRSRLGPELLGAFTSTGWSTSGSPAPTVQSDGTIVFSAAANIASAFRTLALEDNVTYEIRYEIFERTGGGARVLVAGATTNHVGATTSRTTDGIFVERVTTSSATTSTNLVRVQATGSSGTNNFKIRNYISIRKVR